MWYVVHLHLLAEFAQGGLGDAYFTASTNGRTVAQLKFSLSGTAAGSGVIWSSVDLVNGRLEMQESSGVAQVSFSNYAQLEGIQAGVNELSFSFEPAGLDAERLIVYSDSGIEVTPASPPALALRVWSDAGRCRPATGCGSTTRLRIKVRFGLGRSR